MRSSALVGVPPSTRTEFAQVKPVVLDIYGAAEYLGRTVKAMRRMRERRVGPPSFMNFGRVSYRVEELDRVLAENEAADSRSNPDLDPTLKPPEPRRTRASRSNGNDPTAPTVRPLAKNTPRNTGTHQ